MCISLPQYLIVHFSAMVMKCHGVDPVNGDPNWISSLATLFNTDTIATGSRDGHIRIWSVGDQFKSIKPVNTIQVSGLTVIY